MIFLFFRLLQHFRHSALLFHVSKILIILVGKYYIKQRKKSFGAFNLVCLLGIGVLYQAIQLKNVIPYTYSSHNTTALNVIECAAKCNRDFLETSR